MKSRYKLITIIVIIIIICSLIVFLYVSFNGNPITKWKFKIAAQEYLEANYTGEMNIEKVDYSFKDTSYIARVLYKDENVYFNVETFSSSSEDDIWDDLFIQYWKKETKLDISKFTQKIYKTKNCRGWLALSQRSPMTIAEYKEIGKIPDFLLIRDRFGSSVSGYIDIYLNFRDSIPNDEYEKIYQVAKYIIEKYKLSSVRVEYSDDVIFEIESEKFNNLKNIEDIQQFKK